MCGITAWLSWNEGAPVDPDVLARMRDTLAHRGPDGTGLWLAPDRTVGLAFRRLAIIDLNDTANQPMTNEDGSLRLVFNGEIYNHRALRRELEAFGHRFSTDHSDTETIVHGFEQWGADVVHHLEGMFALAIWDSRTRELFLARDRIGIKPLYFTSASNAFLVSSEIKALLAHPGVTAAIEPFGLYHYLSFLTTPAPLTMFKNIFKLPAGHRAVVRPSGDVRLERYWDATPPWTNSTNGHGPSLEEAKARARELLASAIEKRLMSDVPFGVFLSGGVDSSAIVAMMSRQIGGAVRTFTVGFSDHQHLNELQYARRVAQLYRSDHHEVLVDERAMEEYLPRLVYSQDEPIADWVCIPLYFVSKLVRDSGTIVVQVGEGSDEEFCGYESYMGYLRLHQRYWQPFRRLPSAVQRGAAALASAASAVSGKGHLYTDIISRAAQNREHFWGGAMSFWEPVKRSLIPDANRDRFAAAHAGSYPDFVPKAFLDDDTFGVVAHYLAAARAGMPEADVLARMTYLEFKLRLPELLLMRVDKITMSTSIEARVPFLDHHLVAYTMGLPLRLKTQGGVPKLVLKKALEGVLPDDVIHRKKMGFGAPMREWLRGDFGRAAERTVMESRLRSEGYFDYNFIGRLFARHARGEDLSLPLWTLYNLTAWYDRWVEGTVAG
jgi:asparagine synthase (glutamine-hydrolysing)